MKLYQAPTSPYCRKVLIACIEAGIDDRVEKVLQMPRDNATGFLNFAPLGRIPVLTTDQGLVLFDSPVICEYLDACGRRTLFPASGAARWTAIRDQALGDGMLDSLIAIRHERLRDSDKQFAELIAKHLATVNRTLDEFVWRPMVPPESPTIGDVAIATALAYLDFRFADTDWRKGRDGLAKWFATFQQRESFVRTRAQP